MKRFVTDAERDKTWAILRDTGAYMEGHFELSSTKKHYDRFFQVPLALQHSHHARWICVTLARVMRRSGVLAGLGEGKRVTLVAPEDAGIPVAFWLGEAVKADRILWARRRNGGWALRPFIEVGKDDVVLLVDDAVLSGSTLMDVGAGMTKAGAKVLAAAVVVDRRTPPGTVDGLPVYSLVQEPNRPHDPRDCPQCKGKGKALTRIAL